jgi:ribosomal protein S18 acetylase RimI-like enzyme
VALAARAREHRDAVHAAVCDVFQPWAHGTVVRATGHPSFFDLNVVRVEDGPAMRAEALAAFADQALRGLDHRKLDFDHIDAAEPLRRDFEAMGWKATPLIWMRHDGTLRPGPAISVATVPYDTVHGLRVDWHQEDFPGLDPSDYHASAREVALRCNVQVLAVREGDKSVAFAEVEWIGAAAEITSVYVHPQHRGKGHGTAVTRGAIEAASDAQDVWIVAEDEGRARDLYARLGFRPAWTTMEFLRLPPADAN